MTEIAAARIAPPLAPPTASGSRRLCRARACSGCRRSTSGGSPISSANRRGYWSFWIFMVLFVLCLFAEFIANDRPILVRYKGELLFPVFVDYPEEKFGGFLAQTDYRDPVIEKEIEENGWAIWPPIRFASNTHQPRPADRRALAADLDADRRACAGPSPRSSGGHGPAATSNGTGSAPTTAGATCWRASSTASASRCCSG